MSPSPTHLVLLPAYNPGPRLPGVVAEVLRHWRPVLLVVDGSTDGSHLPVVAMAEQEPGLRVLVLPRNGGKGAAVLAGLRDAVAQGFTHALVMDADGQHPAASIAGFMAASMREPGAMILGRPIFGPDVPSERLYGRKLSNGLVCFETLGPAIDDTLFGFRVYPARPLLDVMAPRRGGRRYDFDTEAAVRLFWSGLPAVNLAAPVRYFKPSEGGVSHFHYGRDNLRLAWMHTRLITELLLRRFPALLRQRRRMAKLSAMVVPFLLLLSGLLASATAARAAEEPPLISAEHRLVLEPVDPAWRDVLAGLDQRSTVEAPFEEHRWFPFHKKPVVLKGEVRIDAARGLSLQYREPKESLVIIDRQGMLLRQGGRETTPPADARAGAANEALLHILRFDFASLAAGFELYGRRTDQAWTLALVPRAEDLRRTLGAIIVSGEADLVRRIELRRSAVQRVEIFVGDPRPTAPFTAEELHRFFR
jgi:glycosyltransferase involved in cell wall biosynthesis